jgi:hypothetical protein
LSHRWGSSVITKTNKENLAKRMQQIQLHELTKTMQDSVKISRQLRIRYLWIDALCIIQDSHSDWSVEACDMANIYRNSFLTIAAAAAADHSQGCFTPRSGRVRSQHGRSSDLLSRMAAVFSPAAHLQEEEEFPLDSRGWILQEQLLSPRILKYSKGHLDWECISMTATELSKIMNKSTSSSEIIRFKRALGGFRSTSMALTRQAHTSWQQIVHSYTRRNLSKDTDKLMAIMGIAKYTGDIMNDTFLVGLWRSQLWRDLLWSTDLEGGKYALRPRLNTITFPSWSWASVDGPVSYRWPSGSSPGSVKSLLELISSDVGQEVSQGNVFGLLTVKGKMRNVFRHANDSTRLFHDPESKDIDSQQPPSQSQESKASAQNSLSSPELYESERDAWSQGMAGYDPARRDIRRMRKYIKEDKLLGELKSKNSRSEAYSPDAKSEDFSSAWLLAVATEYYWTHCLVLVPAVEPNTFRRVGLCHADTRTTWDLFDGEYVTIKLS